MLDYAWFMLVVPALGALVISLFGTRLGRRVVGFLAPAMVFLSFLVAVAMFVQMLGLPAEERSHEVTLWQWMVAGRFSVDAALLIDQLSVTMALVVTGIGFLIQNAQLMLKAADMYAGILVLTLVGLLLNYLLVWIERRVESRIPPFEEIRQRVLDDWLEERTREALRAEATRLRAGVEVRWVEDVPQAG